MQILWPRDPSCRGKGIPVAALNGGAAVRVSRHKSARLTPRTHCCFSQNFASSAKMRRMPAEIVAQVLAAPLKLVNKMSMKPMVYRIFRAARGTASGEHYFGITKKVRCVFFTLVLTTRPQLYKRG
jgi:hypothetical protein